MSKKIVPFKMPAKATLRREAKRRQVHPPTLSPGGAEEASPSLPSGKLEYALASEPDRWVQHRKVGDTAESAPIKLATQPYVPVTAKSLTIDVAAERELQEVVALAFLIPPMLGWFWLFNFMKRRWSTFG